MDYFTDYRIGLVLKSYDSVAKCISIIRKHTPASIAEIKSAIDTGDFVFCCEYTSDSGVRKVRRCYDELVKTGATVEIYEDGRLTTREFISNLLSSYHEIEKETQDQIDAEVAAEGGNEE